MACDLAFNAAASPPARPGLVPVGVAVPLLPPFEYPLSLGAPGDGAGLRPAGRFAGGAGATLPFATPFAAGAGGGGGRDATGGGGGACLTSSRYAAGVQPDAEESIRRPSHQPICFSQ